MKIRDKVFLGVAGAAVVAGATTGAAQAAAAKPHVAAAKHAAATPAAPAAADKPQASTAFLGVTVTAKVVTEAGALKVTVGSTTCITDVIAYAYPLSTLGKAASAKSTKKGTSFTLSIPYSKKSPTGTWMLTDVDAVICGTKPAGWNANWNGTYKFTVKK